AAIPEIAVRVLIILVTSVNPVAVNGIFGLFVLVPIERGRTISANQEITNVSLLDRVSTFIGNERFVAWDELSCTPWPYLTCTITDENVQNLGAADTIENIYVEFLL